MSSEDSDDDLHQCGRCREIFRSIADYFEHKKNKFCDRLKSNQLNLLDHCIPSNNVIQSEDSACNSADSKPSFSKANETRVVNETAPSDNRVNECENVSISTNISVNADCQVQSVDCEKKKQCIEVQYSISSLSSSAVNCKQQHGESARSANFNKVVRLMSQPRAICSGNGSRSRLFQCPKCAYVAKFKDDYDRHLRKTHNLSVYVCCRCRTAFSDKYKLKRHLLKPCRREPSQVKGPSFAEFLRKSKYHVDDSRPFGCQLCSDSFNSYDEILKHLSKHINIYPGICRFCGMWFMNRYKLRRHIVSSVHDDIADDLFQSFRKEVDKMKIYVPSESAFGKIGKTTFRCASSRPKIHARKIILGPQRVPLPKQPKKAIENKITCKYCQVVFDVRSNYVLHLRNCRKLAKNQMSCIKLQCACCCKKFHHRSHVTRHQKILHTAKQQVPLSETSNQICKSSTPDKNPRISNLIPCFVCWQKFKTQDRFSEHIECHRIWVPNPVGGPVPSTLFDIVPPVPPIQKADNESANTSNQCSVTKNSQVIIPDSNQTENSENQPRSRTSDVISIKLEEPQKKVADETPDLKSLPCPYCDSTFFSIDMLYWHKIDDHKLLAIFRCSDPTCSLEFETAEQYKCHSEIHSQMSFICQICNEHFSEMLLLILHRLSAHRRCTSGHRDRQPTTNDNTKKKNLVVEKLPSIVSNNLIVDLPELELNETDNSDGSILQASDRGMLHGSDRSMLHDGDRDMLHGSDRGMLHGSDRGMLHGSDRGMLHGGDRDMLHDGDRGMLHDGDRGMLHDGDRGIMHDGAEIMPQSCNKLKNLCDQCGSVFQSKLALSRHKAVHATGRQHVCSICGKDFNKKEHLQRHQDSRHSTAKPFACREPGCNKAFKRKDKLQDHYKCHSAIKPYNCSVCGRKYRYREGLRYHEKMHEREQRYRCTKCTISFPRPSELKRHLFLAHQIHGKKEMYAYFCSICNRSFPRPERLKRHKERDHSLAVSWCYKCEHCTKGFAGLKSYKTHLSRHHASAAACGRMRRPKLVKKDETVDDVIEEDDLDANVPMIAWRGESQSPVLTSESAVVSSEVSNVDVLPEDTRILSLSESYYSSPSSENLFSGNSSHIGKSILRNSKTSSTLDVGPSVVEPAERHFINYNYISEYRPPDLNYCASSYSNTECRAPASSELPQYSTLADLPTDLTESGRGTRASGFEFCSSSPVFSNSFPSYTSYSASRFTQPSSTLHPPIGFYHPNSNPHHCGGTSSYGFHSDDFSNAPLPFPFSRVNALHSDFKTSVKASDFSCVDSTTSNPILNHSTVPFRPVAMPTQHARVLASGNPYSTDTSRFGRWFGNMPLFDGKQSVFDTVNFPRFPVSDRTVTDRTFGMSRHNPYMTSHYSNERQGLNRDGAGGSMEQRPSFMDYNFMSDNASTLRRDNLNHLGHGGPSSLTQVPGAMAAAMHVPLSLLPPQQQQFTVNDYQWPTVPYNWL